jgi:hypothetical protein
MSKNTMFYGLLIAGGLLAYYAFKKQSATSDATANANLNTSTSGSFVDDVPVPLDGSAGILLEEDTIKSISKIKEPLIGTNLQIELDGVRPFKKIEEPTYES